MSYKSRDGKTHQSTILIAENGLPIDAIATISGSYIFLEGVSPLTYASGTATVTLPVGNDITPVTTAKARYTGKYILLTNDGTLYYIDRQSINTANRTFTISLNDKTQVTPAAIDLSAGWKVAEADIVNRIATTAAAKVDSIEFRDMHFQMELDGDPVSVLDASGTKINPSTEEKQDDQITELQSINTELDTQTVELEQVNTELSQANVNLNNIDLELEGVNLELDSINSKIDPSFIDPNNSSTVNLGSGGVFTGDWTDVERFSDAAVTVLSDQDGAEDGLSLQYSHDGIITIDTDLHSKLANQGNPVIVPLVTKYFRVVYTNGTTPTSSFSIQTKIFQNRPKPSSHRVSDSISGDNDAELSKAVLTGKNPNGMFVNGRLDGTVDSLSTTEVLGVSGIFQSDVISVEGFLTIDFTVLSDQLSEFNGIVLDWYLDSLGTQLVKQSKFSYTEANAGQFFNVPVQSSFVRLTYTNTTTTQSVFILNTRLRTTSVVGLLSQLDSQLTGDLLAILTRSVLFGRTEGGTLSNVELSNSNSLKVAVTDRPSEVRSRVPVNINVPDTTLAPAGTTLYTVTPGKILYIHSFVVTQLNAAAAIGSWTLNDAASVKSTFILPERTSGSTVSSAAVASPSMPEPMVFTTNIRLVELTGDVRISGYFIGYEE